MKKRICKIVAVILLLGALTGVLSACKKETEQDQCSVSMKFLIWTMWPKYQVLQSVVLYTEGYPNKEDAVTELNLDIDECPRVHVTLQEVNLYHSAPKQFIYYQPPEEYDGGFFDNFYQGYRLTPLHGSESRTLAHDIYDEPVSEVSSYSYLPNCYQLQRVAGLHTLRFHFPNRNIDATFTLNINIKGDDRAPVTLRAEESDDYTKLSHIDGRDMYIMKHGVKSNKFIPKIGVYNDQGETVHVPMFPTSYNDPLNGPVKAWFRKADEYYGLPYSVGPNRDMSPVRYPSVGGVYLVSFTYTGDETYQPTEYTCYVVIPG